jgi:hypothetical protein
MKIIIKPFSIAALTVLMLTGQSCNDILEEDVISQIGTNYIQTPNGLNDAVEATYSAMRVYYGTEEGQNMTAFGTDSYTMGSDGGWKFMNQYTNQFDSNNRHLRNVWNTFYQAINTANAIVERAPTVQGISSAVVANRIAEAKAIRAHYYFLLTQTFGGVDLRLTETQAPTKVASRASITEMYAAIVKDLQEAIPNLENRSRSSDYGRITKPVAEHMLAKVYLTKATSEAAATDDYANAEALAKSVINNYDFKLLNNFAEVFRQGNDKNDEIIWSTQFTSDPLTNSNGNRSHLFFLMEYDNQPGMQRDVENGRPWKRYRPTNYTLNTLFADRENDSRYSKTFKNAFLSNKPGTYTTNFDNSKPEVTYAVGDTAIYLPGFEMAAAERAKRPYQVLTPSMYTAKLYPTLTKHLDNGRPDRTDPRGVRDFFIYRLADTYLILAEAQLIQGKVADATQTVNVIRKRAAFAGKNNEITPEQMTMEFLMEERERELLGEMSRWYDLKRWGKLVENVRKYNPDGGPNIQDFHAFRPIPQTQIDRTEGGNASFPQNPGY